MPDLYDWKVEGDFDFAAELERTLGPIEDKIVRLAGDPFEHPVDLILRDENDPAVISATMAAHLSELAVQTDGSAQNLHAALRRLEESL